MLVLASPSLVNPKSYYAEADLRESGTTDLRDNTANLTRDREAIICSQIEPENPRSARGEGVNCSPTPIQPTPTGSTQPTPTTQQPSVTPPIGGPIATPTNKPGEQKTEEHKEDKGGGGGESKPNNPAPPAPKGLSKTSHEAKRGAVFQVLGILFVLLYLRSLIASKREKSHNALL